MAKQMVYFFGNGKAEGDKSMKELLGGKGANLAEMTSIGIPVPAGFTITTEVCDLYYKNNKNNPDGLDKEVESNIKKLETAMGMKFGDKNNPLLVSVRSGAASSMPGMMDTILNLGINQEVVEGFAAKTGNPRFVWDAYRRFIQMFGDVAMDVPHDNFEHILEAQKEKAAKKKGINHKDIKDTDLDVEDLKEVVAAYKKMYKEVKGHEFPSDAREQLWGAITAVFRSWNNDRAIKYRQINDIRGLLGTAVNVQAMVFGNMGESSATGVCFSRNPATGENKFYGEYLINAQGEDVVAGIRTPQEITLDGSKEWAKNNSISEDDRKKKFPSLEETMPTVFKELVAIKDRLEKHYKDMQDMEFTIQEGKLYFLQTRNGKRTAQASLRIAVEMVEEKLIDKETALLRIEPNALDQLLHPTFQKGAKKQVIAKGLNASPGAAVGKVVFSADEAEQMAEMGEKVVLVRIETSPEDIGGMNVAQGILTARGGATSHAAVVARQMGKPCVAGCSTITIDYKSQTITAGGVTLKKGDFISLDGSTGEVMAGAVPTEDPQLTGNFKTLMGWADEATKMKVRANADTPIDAKRAREFGAVGIGLCRTEHMFFEGNRIDSVRKMILADDEAGRRAALKELEPMQQSDFEQLFTSMDGYPVIIRLLDPPLHEFLPHTEKEQKELAVQMKVPFEKVHQKVESLHEFNPMLGFRGCRLGIIFSEITEMQITAIVNAAIAVKKKGINVIPEIMFPLIGNVKELQFLLDKTKPIIEERMKASGQKIEILLGTMIEVPRAAITSDEIATIAEFFSFGTNDLTQMTGGFSRDDSGSFLPTYVEKGFYDYDPFQVLDQSGVGRLMKLAITQARAVRKDLEVGICGEHGGEPKTVEFCYSLGMNYVSCSPFRVPLARLASAQAAIKTKNAKK
ncbi:MAG: pyruvate, phosphate dikinase [Spirochaetes bacterium GWF1_51_8]|nr:MAG: pyruvate, phosphate dikinase [Spirochaetes bacterium GWF1_51_8]